jgi:hypothetical protein
MGVKFENYDEESHSQWFSRMPIEEQLKFNAFIEQLADPQVRIPDRYHGAFKRMNALFKLNANPSELMDEQLYLMDQQLVRTYYDANVGARLLAPVTVYQPNPRWQSQHYTISGDTFPAFSKGPMHAFREPQALALGVEPTIVDGVGGSIKWDLPFTLIKQGADGIYNPDFWHSFKAGEIMGKFWNERIYLGTAGEHTSGDFSITGIHNYSGLPTVTIASANAAGNLNTIIIQFLAELASCYEPGNNVILSTAGYATESLVHDSDYTDRSEYEVLKKKFFDSGLVSAWWVDNDMEADANATTTARFEMIRLSPAILKREIIYPLQKKPLLNKEYEDDVSYALIVADIIKVYNTDGIAICDADDTTTSAGIVKAGLFMTGENYRPYAPVSPTFNPASG